MASPPFTPRTLAGWLVFQPRTDAMGEALRKLNSPLLAAVGAAHEVFSCRLACGDSVSRKIAVLKKLLDGRVKSGPNDYFDLIYIFTEPANSFAGMTVAQLRKRAQAKFCFHPGQMQPIVDSICAYYLLNFLPTRVSVAEFSAEWGREE